jgi:hypothetical protein
MAKNLQQKIQELEDKKGKIDEQIDALKKAQQIMGASTAPARSKAKKARKSKKAKKKNKGRNRRSEQKKNKDQQAILKALPNDADKGLSIREVAAKAGREVDVTLRNDVKELLDEKKAKKVGQRVNTRYYK